MTVLKWCNKHVTVFYGSLLLLFNQIYNSFVALTGMQVGLFFKNLNLCLVTNQSSFISKYFSYINLKGLWSTSFLLSNGLEAGLQNPQLPKEVDVWWYTAPVTTGVCVKYFLNASFFSEEVCNFKSVLVRYGSQRWHQTIFLIILGFFEMNFLKKRLVFQ